MQYHLAKAFSRRLIAEIGEDNWRKVIELNQAEDNPNVCRSHDFCDANQIMLEACQELGIEQDVQSERFQALTDAAWSIAKDNDFDCNSITQEEML